MKKLLELLGIILLTSNAAGPLVANKPNNNKAKIKNSPETLNRPKRQTQPSNEQQSQSSTSKTDNQVEFIEKEITLNEDYAKEIQNMLKNFVKNNQIDPLRMINNEGIIRTPLFETDEKEKVRNENIKLLKKLDAALGLSEFKENKTRILILNIKNKNNNIKLVINLNTFYLLGFINNQNKYFYFQEEIINELENKIKKWKELLSLPAAKELNELKEQVETLKKDKKKNQDKIKKIQNTLNEKFKQFKVKENIVFNAKDWSSLKNQFNDKIGQKTKELNKIRYYRGNSEVNNKIAEEYSCEKIDLGYKEDYTPRTNQRPEQTLNAINPNSEGIPISQKTLNDAIANLAKVNNDNKQSQDIKDDLVRMIFVTSEAMRFGSHLKYFNHYKDKDKKEQVVFKNIPENIQNIINLPDPNIYTGTVTITFKIAENSFAGLKPGFLNQPSKSGGNTGKSKNTTLQKDEKKLSDVVITRELGKIPDNSSQTILKHVKGLNSNLDISEIKVENITETTAQITSKYELNWKNYAPQLRGGLTLASEFLEEQRKAIFKKLDCEISYFEVMNKFLNDEKLIEKYNFKFVYTEVEIKKLEEIWKKYGQQANELQENNKFEKIGLDKLLLKELEKYNKYINDKKIEKVLAELNQKKEFKIKIQEKEEKLKQKYLTKEKIIQKIKEDISNEIKIILDKKRIDNMIENEIFEILISKDKLNKIENVLEEFINKLELDKEKKDYIIKKFILNAKAAILKCDIVSTLKNQINFRNFFKSFIVNQSFDFFPKEDFNKIIDKNFLISVVSSGNIDILKLILSKDVNVNIANESGLSPLNGAIMDDNLEIVKLLLAHGADANAQTSEDNGKLTPLYIAAQRDCSLEIVEELINNGADVNVTDKNGDIPLHNAISNDHEAITKLLIEKSANVNKINLFGKTPLLNATFQSNNIDIVKHLLNHPQININISDSAVLELFSWNNPEITEILKQKLNSKGIKKTEEQIKEKVQKYEKIKKQNQNKFEDLSSSPLNEIMNQFISNPDLLKNMIQIFSKIKLSGVIIQPDLGNIEISSGQTQPTEEQIKEKVKQLNPQVDINKIKVQGNSITNIAAIIEANNENHYSGKVTVTFTLAKKASKPSKTQKTITEDKSNYGGFKPGFLNPSTKSNSSSKRVSVGDQAGTSGTQNQNTRGTNHNNQYDVPADNSCLFWSVATAYLLPVRNNYEEFRTRFIQLFGEENLKNILHIQKLLQQYDLENNRDLNQLWYQDAAAHRLVIIVFRNRVVDYIRDNLDRQTNLLLENQNQTFRDFINITETNEVDIDNYLIRMRQAPTWGGTPEIVAMSNLINNNIRVDNDSPYQPVHQNANNNIQIFHINGNHYNFALIPEENRTNHPIAINDNQGNILVVDTTKRPDNLPPTTPKPDTNAIKLPVDDHAQHHTILSNNNEDDDANQGNVINAPELTTTPLQKDEYHFVDKKTEEKSLKNDENLEINLIIKNNNKIKQNVPVVNKPINKNIINAQITATKAINKYNALSKEEKLKKLNEINRYYQTLSENDKKAFKEKLTNTGLAALSGGALTAYGTKMTVSGTAATSVTNAEAMEMTPFLSTSTTESLAAAETITVAETAAVEGGVIAGETGTAAALAPETLGLSLVIGGLAIAGTWMYFAFHHHSTSDIALPASIHHNVYDNIEKWYKFLAHDKLKIKINKNTWNEIKQNKNSQANITKIIKNKFVISDHSGWGGSITNEDFNTLVKVILLHFEQINGYFEILDNKNDGFVIITNTEGDWLGIE
ncbi:ankyrin repeat domain-containing protein [Spiroplasma endosymbiont of Dromius quadrimaculatus]|uniref:ankyrin repeat domain-containing protein n=1 Tax=Spiroplasma endosymbiont of Dromius quadrimaculatus TaxID=3066283 RepID=UPI00313AFBA5